MLEFAEAALTRDERAKRTGQALVLIRGRIRVTNDVLNHALVRVGVGALPADVVAKATLPGAA